MRIFQYGMSLVIAALTASAAPSDSASSLDVKTTIGTFRGVANTTSALEIWRGIPFAQPPVGSLRFKAPVPINSSFKGTQDASKFGSACPQPVSAGTAGVSISEDCLFLNIFRPAKISAKAKLPVLVWIYGGSFNVGTASDPASDPTLLINRSVAIGKPIIFVSLNYRVNTFGFLASSLVAAEDLNAGLHDQRAALEFLQKEITAFGGDPDKVTIWGQSAGAGSVEAQIVYPSIEPLFRAAIMDSSAGPFHSSPLASEYDEPNMPYARIVELTGCQSGQKSLECLGSVPFETLLNISNTLIHSTLNNQLWYPAVGPPESFVPVHASTKITAGDFLHIPVIMGSNRNDGTVFSTSLLNLPPMSPSSENAAFDNFIQANVPPSLTISPTTFSSINTLYPANSTTDGGPFNTGDSLFDRGEAWYTDQMYLSPRRLFFANAVGKQPLFGYWFDEFYPGGDPNLGVFHGSELRLIFGGAPAVEADFANQFTDAYINFVTDLHPGAFWPEYTSKDKRVLHWIRGNVSGIPDDFETKRIKFINSKATLNAFEK